MKIEVECRGPITDQKFKKLNNFFQKNGKFLGKKKRFSIIYFVTEKKIKKIKEMSGALIDLKFRITNKKPELALKYGKWGGRDARKEFYFPISKDKFDEMVEFLKILGFYHGVLNATETHFYKYKNIEFSLVRVPNWGYYFEAEMMVNKNETKKAHKKILTECQKLDLKIFSDNALCKLLDELNNRKGHRFNFKEQKFSNIKKRFIDYF